MTKSLASLKSRLVRLGERETIALGKVAKLQAARSALSLKIEKLENGELLGPSLYRL